MKVTGSPAATKFPFFPPSHAYAIMENDRQGKQRKVQGMSLGDNMKRCRKVMGLTQKDIAERLGITPVSYGSYEQGKIKPSIEKLIQFSQITQVSIDELLDNKVSPFDRYVNLLKGNVEVMEMKDDRVHIELVWGKTPHSFPLVMSKEQFVSLVDNAIEDKDRIMESFYKTILYLYATNGKEQGINTVIVE